LPAGGATGFPAGGAEEGREEGLPDGAGAIVFPVDGPGAAVLPVGGALDGGGDILPPGGGPPGAIDGIGWVSVFGAGGGVTKVATSGLYSSIETSIFAARL